MPRDRGKMLVIRGGAIGDFILTLPAMAALRETFDQTHIEALGYPTLAELARSAGIIEAYKSIESGPLAGFFGRNAKLNEEWMSYFSSFNVILSYLYDPDLIFQTNVGRASKAQFIVGPHRPSEKENIHATEVFLKPLEKLAIFGADTIPRIQLPSVEERSACNRRRLAIHPGSGSQSKNWPVSSWEALVSSILAQTAWDILLVGGEAESQTIKAFQNLTAEPRLKVAYGQPLLETAKLLGNCDFFIGHDSGIIYLAGALGIPLLALWGLSNFEVWRPLGPQTEFIRAGDRLPNLPVEEVFEKLQSAFGLKE